MQEQLGNEVKDLKQMGIERDEEISKSYDLSNSVFFLLNFIFNINNTSIYKIKNYFDY